MSAENDRVRRKFQYQATTKCLQKVKQDVTPADQAEIPADSFATGENSKVIYQWKYRTCELGP